MQVCNLTDGGVKLPPIKPNAFRLAALHLVRSVEGGGSGQLQGCAGAVALYLGLGALGPERFTTFVCKQSAALRLAAEQKSHAKLGSSVVFLKEPVLCFDR